MKRFDMNSSAAWLGHLLAGKGFVLSPLPRLDPVSSSSFALDRLFHLGCWETNHRDVSSTAKFHLATPKSVGGTQKTYITVVHGAN